MWFPQNNFAEVYSNFGKKSNCKKEKKIQDPVKSHQKTLVQAHKRFREGLQTRVPLSGVRGGEGGP